MAFHTPQQQHGFNFPYQIGSADSMSDSPSSAQRFEVAVQPGDLLVLGERAGGGGGGEAEGRGGGAAAGGCGWVRGLGLERGAGPGRVSVGTCLFRIPRHR